MLFGKQTGMIQVLAATTNGYHGHPDVWHHLRHQQLHRDGGRAHASKVFIETNREAVAKDISRGKGETLTSFSALAGCPDSKRVGAVLQSDFAKIFPSARVSSSQVGDNVLNVLRGHPELACKNLI